MNIRKKIENRITFKAKYYLKLSTAETIKLLENTKSKITKKKMVKMWFI